MPFEVESAGIDQSSALTDSMYFQLDRNGRANEDASHIELVRSAICSECRGAPLRRLAGLKRVALSWSFAPYRTHILANAAFPSNLTSSNTVKY